MNLKIFLTGIFFFPSFFSFAREGMWIPSLIGKNIAEMQQMGFKLTARDIYNTDSISMKDAIVHFGSGCTGELISPDGLLVTNYHCGYGEIQSHSSVENDYLTNGFWAMSREQELPNPELKVTFLVSMGEVTDRVLACTDSLTKANEIDDQIQKNIATILVEEENKTGYKAEIKPFYNKNQYFILLTETYTDVRLVGAPPSSIGKFGGDTDNWMWPRHNGDFSLFRIYANKENRPADYSPDNVPYRSKSFFSINTSGIKEGDFTMVFGFPGTTQQYLPSQAIKMILENANPEKVAIRELKLKILSDYMQNDQSNRIKYAAKYALTSNSWKKWQGEMLGLRRLSVVERKIEKEKEFANWVGQNEKRKAEYGNILSDFERQYSKLIPFQKAYDYYVECIYRGFDVYKIYLFAKTLTQSNKSSDNIKLIDEIEKLFKDYSLEIDNELFVNLVVKYYNDLPSEYISPELKKVFLSEKFRINLKELYSKSILTDQMAMMKIVTDTTLKTLKKNLKKDNLFNLLDSISDFYNKVVKPSFYNVSYLIDKTQENNTKALLEMKRGQLLYPDANSTLRVSYGKIEGFIPRNGVTYNYFTTLGGVIEKEDTEVYDYGVPTKLKMLYQTKDFDGYSLPDSTLTVCFIASNHTSGGNSGSPVIDKNGYLIGVNFDRNWEGTMSDIKYDPEKCRNISLDVRYMLFLIDKFAGAGYLLNEMKIIK